ncbi:MAG: plastocyanin/azurin family copper-binding protein [Gemmatimonadales bacterium]
MRRLIVGIAALGVACGGSSESANGGDEAASADATSEPAAAAVETGTVHTVQMELRDGQYLYTPSELTIRVGDTVRWINASGGPHNVAFWADSMPAGASDVINAVMPNKLGDLMGELLTAPNAQYEMTFAEVPVGDYRYYCTPHLALNMVASLTVEE